MPFFGPLQLDTAVKQLARVHPLITSLLAMRKAGVPVSDDPKSAIKFGSSDENKVLERWFHPAGTTDDRPFYIPFGDEERGRLRDRKYAGRTLQKLRTKDWAKFFIHPDQDRFAMRKDIAQMLKTDAKVVPDAKLPLAALSVWLMRDSEVQSVKSAVASVVAEFRLHEDGFSEIFVPSDIGDYNDAALRSVLMTDQEIAEVLGLAAPPTRPTFSRAELEDKIASELEKRDVIVERDIITGVISAWMAHDIAVLVGAPGTGKSTIATHLVKAFVEQFDQRFVESQTFLVDPSYDSTRFIGYANLDGNLVPSAFTTSFLLDETREYWSCVVLLDEWNLANIDEYMAPVLVAIENGTAIRLPGKHQDDENPQRRLPVDTFVIATCNSYIEEPETRRPISRPVKRRCTILRVPNKLAADAQAKGVEAAVRVIANTLITQERNIVELRARNRAATAVDYLRLERLKQYDSYEKLPESVRHLLQQIIAIFLEHESGKRFLTIGILRDVLMSCIYAPDGGEELCIAQQVAGKLMQLYSGGVADLKRISPLFQSASAKAVVNNAIEDYEYAIELGGGEPLPLV